MSDSDKKTAPEPAAGNGHAADESSESLDSGAREVEGAEDELSRLRRRLEEKEHEAQENQDRYLRERAELENFKRRILREQAEGRRFAGEALIRDLLPIVDNLERAIAHAEGGGNGAPLVEGVALVLKSFEETLKRHGVSIVDAKPGEPFDPSRHEALARQETDGEPNRVVAQHERGYFLHDRLLRAAKVVVSGPKSRRDDVERTDDRD